MKTDDLIAMLASHATPPDPHFAARRFGLALLLGSVGALVLMGLYLGLRFDLDRMIAMPLFWAKLAFPCALAVAALLLVQRLGRPGMPTGKSSWLALVAPIGIAWLAALVVLLDTPREAQLAAVFGHTWRECPFNIALLSIPTFVATIWAMKGLAPTRPRLTGAVSGLLAGAVAAAVYSLTCREMAIPFWAVWYLLGMLVPTAIGALAGPRLLRW